MIIMAVAQHQSINLGRVDTEEFRVVDHCLWREAKIDEGVPRLRTTPGIDMHRQAEFADQRPRRRLVPTDTPAEVLDLHHVGLST